MNSATMRLATVRIVPVLLICSVTLGSVSLAAQATPSRPETRLPSKGDRVEITTTDGRRHKGRVESADAASVSLVDASGRRIFRLEEIEAIETPKDSIWNGALYGLGLGAAAGAITADTSASEDPFCGMGVLDDCGGGGRLAAAAAGGTLGALVGASIDTLLYKRDRAIYRRQARVAIVPSVAPRSQRITIAVSW